MNKIKINYNTIFKNFFNKFILANKKEKMGFLDFKY